VRFHLFVTPPHTALLQPRATLLDLQLVPSAVVWFAFGAAPRVSVANDDDHTAHRIVAGIDVHSQLATDAEVADAADTVDTLSAPLLKPSLAAAVISDDSVHTTTTTTTATTSTSTSSSATDKLKSIMASLKREATALVTPNNRTDDDDSDDKTSHAIREGDAKKLPKWLKLNKKK